MTDGQKTGAPGPASAARWNDLSQRMISGGAMALIGSALVVAGGVWFQMLAVFATAVMVWELWMMIEPERPTPGMLLAALVASVLSGQLVDSTAWGLVLFAVVPLAGMAGLRRERGTFVGFALAIQIAGWGLVQFREDYGFTWLLWLILVVVATDVMGYFAGRAIGGPKFWPRVSPKKTWAGTVAGWLGAAAVGWGFVLIGEANLALIPMSVFMSFASQLGDIGESGLKRRMKVKDSSALIPGHGGLFDRFDGLLGAALLMLLVALIVDVPEVRI